MTDHDNIWNTELNINAAYDGKIILKIVCNETGSILMHMTSRDRLIGLLTQPNETAEATEEERTKSRTMGARRAKLPMDTYNKLKKEVDPPLGTFFFDDPWNEGVR